MESRCSVDVSRITYVVRLPTKVGKGFDNLLPLRSCESAEKHAYHTEVEIHIN